MARSDEDTWGITDGAGVTALSVAAARAADVRVFLEDAGDGPWTPVSLPGAIVDPELSARTMVMVDYIATRTALFDDLIRAAVAGCVRQVAILAARPRYQSDRG